MFISLQQLFTIGQEYPTVLKYLLEFLHETDRESGIFYGKLSRSAESHSM